LYNDKLPDGSALSIIRLKVNGKTGAARLLARNEGNGSVVLVRVLSLPAIAED
jgi:hypothetical protein